jgi:Mn2+/Fe2+ NRAMP family transporter
VPPLLVFMLLLVNNKGLMGEYVNSRLFNVIAWSTTIIMTVLNVVWFWMFGTGRG